MYYQGDQNTVISETFNITWNAVGTGTIIGTSIEGTNFKYVQICEPPTSNMVSSDPQPPSAYFYDEYYPVFKHNVPIFTETAPRGGSCALNNFTIVDLIVERFDQDNVKIPEILK